MSSTNAWLPLPLSYEHRSRLRVGDTPLVTHEPRKGVMGGSGFENSSFFPSHQIAARLTIFALGSWFNVAFIHSSFNDADQLMGEVIYRWLGLRIILPIRNHR